MGWYLSRWPSLSPNINLLRAALRQAEWKGALPGKNTWRKIMYNAVIKADWNIVYKDVNRFLLNPSDRDIFTKQNILKLLEKPA